MLGSRRKLSVVIPVFLATTALALPAASRATDSTWRPIAPESGYVSMVVADPRSGQVFAATSRSGIYRSDDRGATWQTSGQGLSGDGVTLLRAAPGAVYAIVNSRLYRTAEGGTSWIATGLTEPPADLALAPSAPEILYVLVPGPRLLRSDDGGVHWTATGGFLPPDVDRLAVDPGDPNHLYASTSAGPFWASLDGGVHWSRAGALPPDEFHHDLVASPAVPATLYIVANGKLLRSRDHGAHWRRIDLTFPAALTFPAGGGVFSIAVLAFPTPRLYAAVGRSRVGLPTRGLLYVSPDEGGSWRLLERSQALHSVAVDPARPRRIYLGAEEQGVLWSRDTGAHWTPGAGLRDVLGLDVAVDPVTPGRLYLSTALGLSTTADGGITWTSLPITPPAFPYRPYRVTPDPKTAGALYVVSGSTDSPSTPSLYRSYDYGASLAPVGGLPAGLDIEEVAIDPVDPRHQFAVGFDSLTACNSFDCVIYPHFQAFSSADGGATWRSFVEPLVGPKDEGLFTGVRIDPLDSRNVYLIGGKSFRSTDRGSSWVPVSLGTSPVRDLVFDPFAEHVLYAAAPTLWKSLDLGLTWAPLTGLPVGVLRLVADRKTPGTLYATTAGSGVWVTTDGGASWAPLGSGLPSLPVQALAADPLEAGHLFATTFGYGGLYVLGVSP
jgi:photosystem II stability/assembly factor-like uncharacterized protein